MLPATCLECGTSFQSKLSPEPFDLTARLRAYERASPLEQSQIEGVLTEISSEYDRIDAEVARLEALVAALQQTRKQLKSKANTLGSLLSPIRALPMDILAEIFLINAENTLSSLTHDFPAAKLGRVCFFWHSVVLSNRRLWSEIRVEGDVSPLKFRTLLSNSKKAPLTISFSRQSEGSFCALFSEACKEHLRWRSITFPLTIGSMTAETCSSLRNQLPLLESVTFSSHPRPHGEKDLVPKGFYNTFELAPKLREVAISSFSPQLLNLPWRQITTLRCEEVFDNDILPVLENIPSLLYLVISRLEHKNADETSPVTLPTLATISISDDSLSWRWDYSKRSPLLIEHLITPSLTTVSVTRIRMFNTSAFHRCHALTKLDLVDVKILREELVIFFESFPSLAELTFRDHHTHDECGSSKIARATANPEVDNLFQRMTVGSNSIILPRLTHLALTTKERGPLDGFSTKYFLAMIKSRWYAEGERGASRLKQVRVELCSRKWPKRSADSLKKISAQVPGQTLDIQVWSRRAVNKLKPRPGRRRRRRYVTTGSDDSEEDDF